MNQGKGYPNPARFPPQQGFPVQQRSPVHQQQQQFKPGHRPNNSADLAKQYERDIHQINKYLFRELGENGHRTEKYIAHVRIIEDSKSPSTRPAPNSLPKNKKPRILIMSTKQSGRVRMHKARENPDGSIQIGRTWDFEELSKLELDDEVATGFILEIGKLYYWETNTPKERRVWLTSVLEQYIKYFNGKKIPELINCSLQYFHLQGLASNLNSKQRQQSIQSNSSNTSNQPVGSRGASSVLSGSPALAAAGLSSQFRNRTSKASANESDSTSKTSSVVRESPTHFKLPQQDYTIDYAKERTHQRNTSNKSIEKFMALQAASSAEKDKERQEAERATRERLEAERTTRERLEVERITREKLEMERKREMDRMRLRREAEERERSEKERLIKERQARIEQEQIEKEKIEKERIEKERIEKERIEKERIEKERKAREIAEKEELELKRQRSLAQEALSRNKIANKSDNFVTKNSLEPENSVSHERSLASSLGSINFVGHRHSLNEIEDITVSPTKEYDDDAVVDYDDEYYDEGDDYDRTTPLNLSGVNPSSIPNINIQDDTNRTLSQNEVTEETALSRPHARSRAFSRVDTEMQKQKDFYELFEEIGYDPETDDAVLLEKKIMKELERLEFQKINSLTEVSGTLTALTSSVDNAISDCDKIDPLISLFAVQLSGFKEDVDYIERQGHGLQVETTNKKLLIKELNDILHSVDIPEEHLNFLLSSKVLSGTQNSEIEKVLNELYISLVKIRGTGEEDDNEMGQMRALQDKKRKFEQASNLFISNFKMQVSKIFNSVCMSLNSKLSLLKDESDYSRFINEAVVNKLSDLLSLTGAIAFVKQVSKKDYQDIISIYQKIIKLFFDNFATVLIDNLKYTDLSLPHFSFDAPPSIIIDEGSAKLKSSSLSKSKKHVSNNHYERLEELGLGSLSTNAKPTVSTSKNLSKEQQLAVSMSSLIKHYFSLLALHQRFMIKLFSISSSSTAEFENVIKRPIEFRISDFKLGKEDVLSEIETNRDISDVLFEILDGIHGESSKSVTDTMTSACNVCVLEVPPIILYSQTLGHSLGSSNQEYVFNKLSKLESKLNKIWSRWIDKQISVISAMTIECLVLPTTKAFPALVRKVENIIFALQLKDYEEFASYKDLIASYESLWSSISGFLVDNVREAESSDSYNLARRGTEISISSSSIAPVGSAAREAVSAESLNGHLTLLLNYKWLADQVKDLATLPPHIKATVDELRSIELSRYCQVISETNAIGDLMELLNHINELAKTHTNPSRTNAYSNSVVKKSLNKFQGSGLSETVKEVSTILSDQIFGRCHVEDVDKFESQFSSRVGIEIEKDLYVSCMNSLCVIYISNFSKLGSILKEYYDGISNPADKTMITRCFNKETQNV